MRYSVGIILLALGVAAIAHPVAEPHETCFAIQPPGEPHICNGTTAVPSNNNYYYLLDSIQSVNVGICCSVKGYSNGEEYWFGSYGYDCNVRGIGVPWEVTTPQYPQLRCHTHSGSYGSGTSFQWHYGPLTLESGQGMDGIVDMRE